MARFPSLTAIATLLLLAMNIHAEEPKVPQNVLLKPTFLLANESWSGGTAFLVRVIDKPETMMVTCHHLFGPATGRSQQMSPEEIARGLCGAVGLSMQDRRTIVVSQTYLKVINARATDKMGAEKDVALFVVQADKLSTLHFSDRVPNVGDTVYLFARLRSETEPKLFRATIAEASDNWLMYTFADTGIDLHGTSGAPVLDEKGDVVGMNVGGGEQNGHVNGIANPTKSIRAAISSK